MDIDTILRNFGNSIRSVRSDVSAELQGIDGHLSLSGIGLGSGGHETLREEERRHPERVRGTVVPPVGHEFESLDQVICPAAQWLERGITERSLPSWWHLVVLELSAHDLQIKGHNDCTINGPDQHVK